MTPEELLKLASIVVADSASDDMEWGTTNRLLAQGYVQLHAENAALSAKLETAEAGCVHLREARQVDLEMLAKMDDEQVALSAKLQEVQAELDAAEEALQIERLEPPASRGEVVKACPSCGKHEDGQLVFTAQSGAFYADCCCNGPVEPALWQRVGGQP